MSRRTGKYQDQVDRMARARAAEERKRREEHGHHPDIYPPELPALSALCRMIEITDLDSGTPVTHRFALYLPRRLIATASGSTACFGQRLLVGAGFRKD
jgi:hypothetical protein